MTWPTPDPGVGERQGLQSADIATPGDTFDALRAGSQLASATTVSRSTGTARKVSGSVALTSYNIPSSTWDSASASSRPTPNPNAHIRSACRITSRTTSAGIAPN